MKVDVTLICNDIQLYNAFSSSDLFGSVKVGSELDLNIKYDCLIISDRILGYNDILNMIDKNRMAAASIFYLMSSDHSENQISTIKYVLKSKSVFVIPPRLTSQQILDKVCESLKIDLAANKNVITFFGADSKVGTTITAQAVAEALANNTELQVCFLNLSGQPSFNYIQGSAEGYGIDIIKTKILNYVLSGDELKSAMINKGNLSILPSVKTLTDLRYYKPKHTEYLINLASNIFDIVIVDAGYYPNSGLFIGSLNATKQRYMVATQQEACRVSFEITNEQILDVLDINTSSIMLVINRYSSQIDLPNAYRLADEVYKMVLAASLPNVPWVFWQTEAQRKTLAGFDDAYDNQLNELVKIISSQLGIEYRSLPKPKKKGMLRIFR
jgi:Flp pilus assembly CpaE family ATPase